MTLRSLPEARSFPRPQNYHGEAPAETFARWADLPPLAAAGEDNVISMFEVIGEDYWSGGGVTAKRVSAALRAIGAKDVTVRINSPGGDMFEGIAIYNLLRAHPARVSVEVLGWAASAASIIAMAGDEIRMGLGTFMMVHNAWGMVVGNKADFRAAGDLFEQFDTAIADIYAARTNLKRDEIVALMDGETFMSPTDAVAKGFADAVDSDLGTDAASAHADDRGIMARRKVEAALAKAGLTRDQRFGLLQDMTHPTAARDAGRHAARDAGIDPAALQRLLATMQTT